jgi:hypothetical protein
MSDVVVGSQVVEPPTTIDLNNLPVEAADASKTVKLSNVAPVDSSNGAKVEILKQIFENAGDLLDGMRVYSIYCCFIISFQFLCFHSSFSFKK